MLLNIVIFSAAAFFLGIESALYSMLTYFAASKTVDFLIHGVEEYTAVIIMSEHSEEIRQLILRELERGVTVYKGRRRIERRRAGHSVLRGYAFGDRENKTSGARHRSKRVHRGATAR